MAGLDIPKDRMYLANRFVTWVRGMYDDLCEKDPQQAEHFYVVLLALRRELQKAKGRKNASPS
jgi:ABC-type Zn uptake system ZnuABC Zn-binding protein ZnuA|tara:strand:- start:10640 stop:10828 length:189 start_codon:yes stop_codon:yes gene_type:complete